MKLLYIANIRLPTEKAHGLQIMQNCEAFADAGADVTLWIARRFNTPELRGITDVWAHYGVKRNFGLRRLPCIDLVPLVPEQRGRLAQAIFQMEVWTFALAVLLSALFTQADVIYSRDEAILLVLSLIMPRSRLAYEAHTLAQGRLGCALQRRVVGRVGHVFATTGKLTDDLIALGATATTTHTAHDGIRRERFAHVPDQAAARQALGWPVEGVVVGYVGRLQTMAMDKGVGALVEALAQVGDCRLALVGGPDAMAEEFRARWIELGQDDADFLYAGQVAPDRVPLYLSAFDVCAMPFPWTTHFAYYASPIKLFEYMASKRALVASNLPSIAEVVVDGDSALLTPPADVQALAEAIRRLRDDADLRIRLAENAYRIVMESYTWEARAQMILAELGRLPT
ncbi:MAG: glycosyltransferase [Chloroflexi bacterium]|nr:glycosyltransferase [Chloroflexota bacterium]